MKINPDKTKIVYIDLKYTLKCPQLEHCVDINNILCKLSDSEKNLGVMFDKNLNMTQFINAKIKSVNYQLYNIRIIRKSLNFTACTVCTAHLYSECGYFYIGLL